MSEKVDGGRGDQLFSFLGLKSQRAQECHVLCLSSETLSPIIKADHRFFAISASVLVTVPR